MKYINYINFTMMLILVVLMPGCYQDYVKFTPYTSTFESKQAFYKSVQKKDVIVKTNADKSFVIEHGDLLIQFKDSSFVKMDDNAAIIVSDVDITISTFSNAGKMVLNNRPSTSYESTVKESIAAHQYIYFTMKSGEDDVVLANGKKARVYWQSESEINEINDLYTFKPMGSNEDSWQVNDLGQNNLIYTSWLFDENGDEYSGKGYVFDITDNWTCFGSYLKELYPDGEDYKSVDVDIQSSYYFNGEKFNLPEEVTENNTDVFLIQGDLPSVSRVNKVDDKLTAQGIYNNSKSSIVVLSEMNNKLFYAEKDISNIKDLEKVKLTPLPHEPSDIIKKLLKH